MATTELFNSGVTTRYYGERIQISTPLNRDEMEMYCDILKRTKSAKIMNAILDTFKASRNSYGWIVFEDSAYLINGNTGYVETKASVEYYVSQVLPQPIVESEQESHLAQNTITESRSRIATIETEIAVCAVRDTELLLEQVELKESLSSFSERLQTALAPARMSDKFVSEEGDIEWISGSLAIGDEVLIQNGPYYDLHGIVASEPFVDDWKETTVWVELSESAARGSKIAYYPRHLELVQSQFACNLGAFFEAVAMVASQEVDLFSAEMMQDMRVVWMQWDYQYREWVKQLIAEWNALPSYCEQQAALFASEPMEVVA